MNHTNPAATPGVVVEEEVRFTLVELCRACRCDSDALLSLIHEGVLTPLGSDSTQWHFEGSALQRARTALRLTRDLELNAAGAALVLDLLDEIETLRSRLRRLGVG
jgi:chaperone modulatory protein CbpM